MKQNFPRIKFGFEILRRRRSVKARFPNNRNFKSITGNERNELGHERGRGNGGDDESAETNGKALVSAARTRKRRREREKL